MNRWSLWSLLVVVVTLIAGGIRAAEIDPDNPPLDPAIEHMTKEPRVALIIGNGSYDKWPPLRNPRNDANRMAEVLTRFGFDVIVLIDANRKKMEESVSRFNNKLRGGGVALVFYAGHGIQYAGQNLLIPVDAPALTTDNVDQGIRLAGIVGLMSKAGTRLNIAIIDACRTPPVSGGSRAAVTGLAQPEKARATLFSFATAPDSAALDGLGDNSPFSEALASNIEAFPGLKIEALLKRVLTDVMRKTGNAQEPWLASSLPEDFYFDPRKAGDAVPPIAPAPVASPAVAYTRLPGWRELGLQIFARSQNGYTESDVVQAIAQRKRLELLWMGVRQLQLNTAHTVKAMWLLSTLNDVRRDCDQLIEHGQVAPCALQLDRIELEVTALGVIPSAVQVGKEEVPRGPHAEVVAPPPVKTPLPPPTACDPAKGEPEVMFPDWRGEVSEADRQRGRKLYGRVHCLCEGATSSPETKRICMSEVARIRESLARKRLDEAERELGRLTQRIKR